MRDWLRVLAVAAVLFIVPYAANAQRPEMRAPSDPRPNPSIDHWRQPDVQFPPPDPVRRTRLVRLPLEEVRKIQAHIYRWRAQKLQLLPGIEKLTQNSRLAMVADRTRVWLGATEDRLDELEALITSDRFDLAEYARVKADLSKLALAQPYEAWEARKGFPGMGGIPSSGSAFDCAQYKDAGFITKAQCEYCQERPEDDCFCRTTGASSPCTWYCDSTGCCGAMSIFAEASDYNRIEMSVLCHEAEGSSDGSSGSTGFEDFSQKANQLLGILAGVIEQSQEAERSTIRGFP